MKVKILEHMVSRQHSSYILAPVSSQGWEDCPYIAYLHVGKKKFYQTAKDDQISLFLNS